MINTVCSAPSNSLFFILYLSESIELAKNTDEVPVSEWDCCIPLEAGGTGKINRMCTYNFLSISPLIWTIVNTLTFSSGARINGTYTSFKETGDKGDAVCFDHQKLVVQSEECISMPNLATDSPMHSQPFPDSEHFSGENTCSYLKIK